MKYVIIGDIMIDKTIYGTVDRISPEAPIPVIQTLYNKEVVGGAGNVARNIRAVDPLADEVAAIGITSHRTCSLAAGITFKYGKHLNDDMQNIKLRYIDVKTGYQLLRVDNEQAINVLTQRILPTTIEQALETIKPNAVILSDYCKGIITPTIAKLVITWCRANRALSFVDTRRRDISIFQGASYITPNQKEYFMMAGNTNPLDFVHNMNLDGLLLTKGHEGIELHMNDEEQISIPPTNRDRIIDVTGAGDTVVASFAVALCNGFKPEEAVLISNKLAGQVCMKSGTAIPDETIENFKIKETNLTSER